MPSHDRKSTRLNSSHGSISYAVFCLKKKNSSRRLGSDAPRPDLHVERGAELVARVPRHLCRSAAALTHGRVPNAILVFFFFLMNRPPPKSPLFPPPPLFR